MLKQWLSLCVKLSLTVGAVWFLQGRVDLRAAVASAATLTPIMMAAALGLLLLHILVCAARWAMVVQAIGGSMHLSQACVLSCIGNFFGQALPSGVGGDAIRIWKAHEAGLHP